MALHWSLRNIYGVKPDEVFWTASDVGWVVGHSYIVYAPLLLGCTTVMYEGKPVGTPDAGAFWRVIEQHRVRVFFTAPTAFRAIKREDPDGRLIRAHDLRQFRALFLAGERADPPTVAWAEEQLGIAGHRPLVADRDRLADRRQLPRHRAAAGQARLVRRAPCRAGTCACSTPKPRARRARLAAGEIGALAVKLPLPPGALPTLWQADDSFVAAYLQRLSRVSIRPPTPGSSTPTATST